MIGGDTATASSPGLEVSVSFGRFENDTSLSWEKWSAFSPNKYLEEVEKCATPGSVAQKKAYFEAHYKKIAARKAELLELERLAQTEQNPNHRDLSAGDDEQEKNEVSGDERIDFVAEIDQSVVSGNECESLVLVEKESEIDKSVVSDENCKSLVIERESEIDTSVVSNEHCKSLVIERESEIETSVVSDNECESVAIVEREEEIDERVVSDKPSTTPEFDVANGMEVVSSGCTLGKKEEEEAPASSERELEIDTSVVRDNGCEILVAEREEEIDKRVVSDELIKKKEEAPVSIENSKSIERGTFKLDSQKEPRKVISMIKERVAVVRPKNIAMSPNPKTRTPNPITRTPSSVTKTPNRFSTQRLTNSRPTSASSRVSESSIKKAPLSKNSAPSPREAKRVVTPKSIQTMSVNSGHAKSSSVSSLPADRKSLIMERMGDKDIIKRAFKAFQNNNFDQVRSYGADESPFQKQVSSKRTEPKVSTSTMPRKENGGLNKADRADKRNVKKSLPSSFGSKSLEREDLRRELTKKPELKSDVAEKTRLQTRSKESPDLKATPMPAFYRGQKVSKSSLDKMPAKTVTGR